MASTCRRWRHRCCGRGAPRRRGAAARRGATATPTEAATTGAARLVGSVLHPAARLAAWAGSIQLSRTPSAIAPPSWHRWVAWRRRPGGSAPGGAPGARPRPAAGGGSARAADRIRPDPQRRRVQPEPGDLRRDPERPVVVEGSTPTPSSSCGAAAAHWASVSRPAEAGSSFDQSQWYPSWAPRTARSRASPASRPAVTPSPRARAGGPARPPGRSGPIPTRCCASSALPTAASWSPSMPLGWPTASAGADPGCRLAGPRGERLWTCA
jgi:hypothetical protein